MQRRSRAAIAITILSVGAGVESSGCRSGRVIERPTPPETRLAIGVPLPLSGKMKAYGNGGRDAVRLAIGELDRPPNAELRVVVRDSKGDAEGAALAEIHEALLYDATRFMRQILTGASFETTDDLRARIREVRDFEGVTGAISFVDGTDAHRALRILTIKDQAIEAAKR